MYYIYIYVIILYVFITFIYNLNKKRLLFEVEKMSDGNYLLYRYLNIFYCN